MPLEMLSVRTISIRGNTLYRFIQIFFTRFFTDKLNAQEIKLKEFRYVDAIILMTLND